MKNTALLFTIAFVLALAACNQPSTPTETPAKAEDAPAASTTAENATPPDSAAMMKAWMDYATPGDMHAMLAKFDGEWNGDMTMWMAPDAPPEKSTGVSVNKMILGGRYQESKHTGTFGGMPFEGVGTLAYDNTKKKFINTWIDNFGSGIMVMEGTWDTANYTMHLSGKQVDPVSGQDFEVRQIFKIIDDNTQLMEMFSKYPSAPEYKSLEIKFTRKI